MAGGDAAKPSPYKLRFARRASGRYPANEYLEQLAIKDRDSFDKFTRLFERFEKDGPDALGRAYKALEGQGGIVELGLIRFGGHLPKGGYDVPNAQTQHDPAAPAAVL